MEAIPILFIIFGAITAWILGPRYLKLRHEERLRQLQLGLQPNKALTAERDELAKRVEHLESIVCSVEFELNAKLSRLSTQTQQLALPAGSSGPAPLALPGTLAGDDPSAAPAVRFTEGQKLAGRFVIRHAIGSGGMGAVYAAHDESLGETVALKVVRDPQLATPTTLARFRREVSLARRIQHPNVVRIHDLAESDGLLFLSMELVEGVSLRTLLERLGKLEPERVARLLGGLLDALSACHEHGIVHRDIKAENVIVRPDQSPILIDFGLARLDLGESVTSTHAIIGTPHYMSPEQLKGLPVDARSDLYATGVLAYELLSGRLPFVGSSSIAIGFAHCSAQPPTLELNHPSVEAWRALIHRALEKEPERRFATALEMKAALPR